MYPVLAIGAAVLVLLGLGARYWNQRRLYRRATEVLRRLEEALAGRGHVVNFRWLATTQFEAALRFASCNFQRATIQVQFSTVPLPALPWLQNTREERERLVFFSDLEVAPRFRLNVLKQRWTAQSGKIKCQDPARWNYESVI